VIREADCHSRQIGGVRLFLALVVFAARSAPTHATGDADQHHGRAALPRYDQRIARTLTREDTTSLVLHQLQERAKPVPPAQLGMIGPEAYAASHYARHTGIAAQHGANIPFVVEAWADCQRSDKRGDGSAKIQPRGACSIPVVG
jgi:hypothetical protein